MSASRYQSRLATIKAAFGLVGAILQGGRGGGTGEDVERTRREPIVEGFGPTDVYLPRAGHSRRAAVLMVHGLTRDGPDDPRIPGFASTIARGGMAVLVPEFRHMRERLMRVEDVEETRRAALAVPGFLEVDKAVLLAFSYAAGPAHLASARMSGDQLAGTITVGAYWSLDHVLEFTATGRVSAYEGVQVDVAPDPERRREGQWAFLNSAGRWLDDDDEAGALARAVELWKRGDPPSFTTLRERLGPVGRTLVDAVDRRAPAAQRQAVEKLPSSVTRAYRSLNLEGRIDGLTTPVVLIHGRHDQRIPWHESILLHDHLRDQARVRLAILNAFVHAQRQVGWSKFWRVAGDAIKLGRCGLEILDWSV